MRVYVKTYGCQMNVYDSSRMTGLLKDTSDAEVDDSADDADLILLNTCSIREKAQEKVSHELGRYRSLKKSNSDLLIGVGGCMASQEGDFAGLWAVEVSRNWRIVFRLENGHASQVDVADYH